MRPDPSPDDFSLSTLRGIGVHRQGKRGKGVRALYCHIRTLSMMASLEKGSDPFTDLTRRIGHWADIRFSTVESP